MDVVMLNSGGVDTLVTAYILKEQGYTIHSLYIDLGQMNGTSAKIAAQKIADEYCSDHFVMKVEGEWEAQSADAPNGIAVPYQNAVYHLMAAIYARKMGWTYIASGIAKNVGSDFIPILTDLLNTLRIAPNPEIPLRPLDGMSLFDVTTTASNLPLAKETVSCNQPTPCGTCVKCKKRKEFGIDD